MHTSYMQALFTLQRELSRELDRAQLGELPGDDFASAVARAAVERQMVLDSNPKTCGHIYWDMQPGGTTVCRTCGVDTTDMEAMGG